MYVCTKYCMLSGLQGRFNVMLPLFPLLSPLGPPSPSLGVCVDVFLVQCRVCLSTSSLCQVAGQEEGVCRAGQEDGGESVGAEDVVTVCGHVRESTTATIQACCLNGSMY